MRKYLPVYTRMGPKLELTEHGACGKDPSGEVTWKYDGRLATGKGIYVCATARGATLYMTKLLCAIGYDIGHEAVGVDGSVGYHLAVIRPENCFHQVRHPLSQIASMVAHKRWGFIDSVINVPSRGLYGCMVHWLTWNKLIEEFAVWRYRIESLPEIWDEFLDRIEHGKCPIPEIPRDENSSHNGGYLEKFKYEELTWASLFNCNRELAQEIKDKSEEYGYCREDNSTVESQGTLTA